MGNVCHRRVLTVAKGTPRIMSQDTKAKEVMEVKVCQAYALTGCLKGVSYITPPMPRCIVKDPRQVLPGS